MPPPAGADGPDRTPFLADRRWGIVLAAVGAAVVISHLVALNSVPPGLYADEASVGYNAYSIAHHGVDEHGAMFPLYFEAFGEYKNPVYIYLLAPFTWILPMSAATIRLPAALLGILTCACTAAFAWRVTRNRPATMLTLITAAATPWLLIQGRVGFEVVAMTASLSVALVCAAHMGEPGEHRWWSLGCGVGLGVSVFAYSSGRAYVALLLALLVVGDVAGVVRRRHRFRWLPVSARRMWFWGPVLVAYAVLAIYILTHPGNLTGRYQTLSIGADGPDTFTWLLRLGRNALTYTGVPFLFTQGDAYLRHNPHYGGMLLVTSAPALVAGLAACWRRRTESWVQLLIIGLVVAPIPAALTFDDTPHALRSTAMLPSLLAVIALGWGEILPLLTMRRAVAVAAGAAVAIDVVGATWHLYAVFPGQSAFIVQTDPGGPYPTTTPEEFDDGLGDAVVAAHAMAGAHRVWLSDTLDNPEIQALAYLHPAPALSRDSELASIGMINAPDAQAIAAGARPGDLAVIGASEAMPARATEVLVEVRHIDPSVVTLLAPEGRDLTLVRVVRFDA